MRAKNLRHEKNFIALDVTQIVRYHDLCPYYKIHQTLAAIKGRVFAREKTNETFITSGKKKRKKQHAKIHLATNHPQRKETKMQSSKTLAKIKVVVFTIQQHGYPNRSYAIMPQGVPEKLHYSWKSKLFLKYLTNYFLPKKECPAVNKS